MTQKEVLGKLQSMGSDKVMQLNLKNGAGSNQFGVKMGDIRKVAKEVKKDHDLALELWETGNIEARLTAILILKPKLLSTEQLDEMVRSITYFQVAEWFNAYVLKDHPEKESLREKWMDSDNVWAARSGWSLTAGRIARNPEGMDLPQILNRLEREMPHAAPEVQWTMNIALANMGIYHPQFCERAICIGEQLGIYRDYPVSRGCTSPFAPVWIQEMVRRQKGSA